MAERIARWNNEPLISPVAHRPAINTYRQSENSQLDRWRSQLYNAVCIGPQASSLRLFASSTGHILVCCRAAGVWRQLGTALLMNSETNH